jgi:hypothetical protein
MDDDTRKYVDITLTEDQWRTAVEVLRKEVEDKNLSSNQKEFSNRILKKIMAQLNKNKDS